MLLNIFVRIQCFFKSGADRDRTDDLVNAIHALSQLSYSPIILFNLKRSDFSAKRYRIEDVDMLLLAG